MSHAASIDDSDSENEDPNDGPKADNTMASRRTTEKLLRFRSLFTRGEASGLVSLYRDVSNDFYPLVDMDRVEAHLEIVYGWPGPQSLHN